MIIEISIAVVAVAFLALVIYLILLISTLRVTLGQVNQTLVETRKQMNELGGQTQKVLEHTNQISFDLKKKVEAFNPIFNALEQAGHFLEKKTSALNKRNHHLTEDEFAEDDEIKLKEKMSTVAAILELSGIGIKLWQKLQKGR